MTRAVGTTVQSNSLRWLAYLVAGMRYHLIGLLTSTYIEKINMKCEFADLPAIRND